MDANYNRGKEALRVIEDIFRFLWIDRKLTKKARLLRHSLTDLIKNKAVLKEMIAQRDSDKDIGKRVDNLELRRESVEDVVYANMQRAKESVRVLEEISKIADKKNVYSLKSMRYNLYSLEKDLNKKMKLNKL